MFGKPSDIELIRKVMHENDSRAFGELMQRYSSQVYGAALRLMKDEEEASEIVQMAFIQAYKHLDSWRGENFGAWVTIIANHMALRQLERLQKRRTETIDENTDTADEGYDEEHEEKLQRLEEAVGQLPEQDRFIIEQHYYQNIPLAELARQLGQTENNIKVRLFRIRERLKKMCNV